MTKIELKPEHVDLQLLNGQELVLLVRRATFEIREFKWEYKQLSFPYLSSGGDADCFCDCLQVRAHSRVLSHRSECSHATLPLRQHHCLFLSLCRCA